MLVLKASIEGEGILALKEEIIKLLHSHEESVKMKLDEVSKMASVSLCS
jgi:hypothetical protein